MYGLWKNKSNVMVKKIKECHCMSYADKYYTRTFINQMNFQVIRVFYECRNCKSRIYEDFIPEVDELNYISAFDLMKSNYH